MSHPFRWPSALLLAGLALAGTLGSCGTGDDVPVGPTAEALRTFGFPPARQPAKQPLALGLRQPFILAQQGKTGAAREAIARYIATEGQAALRYQAEMIVGFCYQMDENFEQARQHLDRVLRGQSDYFAAWYQYGYALYGVGDLDKARLAFEQHVAFNPRDGNTHYSLGLVALAQGRLDDAEGHFRSTVSLLQALPEPRRSKQKRPVSRALARLGEIHERRDELEEARASYEEAVALWPGQEDGFYRLSRVLLRLGDEDAANEAMARHEEIVAKFPGRQQREGMR